MKAALALLTLGLPGAAVAQDAAEEPAHDLAWHNNQQLALAELKAEDGWHVLPGGLKYRLLTGDGSGPKPTVEDTVTVHYTGWTTDGEMFDSSVERGIGPDATIHLDFALHRLAGVVENLLIYPDRMMSNMMRLGGLHNSQRVLLALVEAGVSREDSYRLVQRNAMRTWAGEGAFLDFLKADDEVSSKLSDEQLEALFDLDYHFKRVDLIFDRVFK